MLLVGGRAQEHGVGSWSVTKEFLFLALAVNERACTDYSETTWTGGVRRAMSVLVCGVVVSRRSHEYN